MTKNTAFNLSMIDTATACDTPFKLEFEHPVSKTPLGFGVMVLGKDSAVFKAHVRARANERLRRQAHQAKRGKDGEVPTIERIEDDAIDLLVACTTDIWGEIKFDASSAPLTYSADNVRQLYAKFAPLREQVDEAVGDLDNFLSA